jgi:hypothetical protein
MTAAVPNVVCAVMVCLKKWLAVGVGAVSQ